MREFPRQPRAALQRATELWRNTRRGSAGDDRLKGSAEADRLSGGAGQDRLAAGAGDDWLFGGAAADTLRGGDGCDRASGGDGADLLFGGAGPDLFVFAGRSGTDIIRDFAPGKDRLVLSDGGWHMGRDRPTGQRLLHDVGAVLLVGHHDLTLADLAF